KGLLAWGKALRIRGAARRLDKLSVGNSPVWRLGAEIARVSITGKKKEVQQLVSALWNDNTDTSWHALEILCSDLGSAVIGLVHDEDPKGPAVPPAKIIPIARSVSQLGPETRKIQVANRNKAIQLAIDQRMDRGKVYSHMLQEHYELMTVGR